MSNTTVYVFTGEDTFSSSQKVSLWKKKFIEKHGMANCQTIDCSSLATAEDESEKRIASSLRGGTLFSSTTLTILTHLWSKSSPATTRDLVEKKIQTLSGQTFVVIHDEKMDGRTSLAQTLKKMAADKRASIEEFAIPRHEQLNAWIHAQSKKLDGTIEAGAVAELVRRYDPERAGFQTEANTPFTLWEVDLELKKLISFATQRPISISDVRALTVHQTYIHIFDLSDAIFSRAEKKIRTLLHDLSGNERDVRGSLLGILFFLETQVRDALLLKLLGESGTSQADISAQLSWNPKRVWVVLKKLSGHSGDSLARLYHTLLQAEMNLKTHQSPLALMDLLVRDLAA